jgi:perosamine synthetase
MIPVSQPDLSGNEARYVADAMDAGWISGQGDFIGAFEQAFGSWTGARHTLAVNTGTAALHLCLAALGVGPGDEVIVPALSYIATANAVTYCGAKPVFADVDPKTWTIDPDSIERLVTRRARAIVAVHLFGVPADMHALERIAQRLSLPIVEDAAQAHGATYGGRMVGSIGDMAAFSFFGNKIITTGEGGMVTTNDITHAGLAQLLAHQGQTETYKHPTVGYNYRMTNLEAAIGLAQLERVKAILAARKKVARMYANRGLACPQRTTRNSTRVWWQYPILTDDPTRAANRLTAAGVESRPMFRPLHRQCHYSGSALVAEDIARRGLILPLYPTMTAEDVDKVVNAL